MNYFEKRILGGLEVSTVSVQYCEDMIKLNKSEFSVILDQYYVSLGSSVDLDEFNRLHALLSYVVAIYTEKKRILIAELALYDIEVISRLV